jgi:uncharacterized protein (TIGR00297 family)
MGNIALSASISALFALFAWLLRGVNASGALAGFAVAFTLYAAGSWRMFELLLLVFGLTWAATRLGRARQHAKGLIEPGARTAVQVVANVGLVAWWVAIEPMGHSAADAPLVAVAVLCEAAADTCASEVGKAFGGKTRLITTWREVPPGTDGAVSWAGLASGFAAAVAVSVLADYIGVFPSISDDVLIAPMAGFGACLLDSVLGATMQRRGWLNNDGVNLLSTAATWPAVLLVTELSQWLLRIT